jgi:hypothetical protein
MERMIHKYILTEPFRDKLRMPQNAKILCIQIQKHDVAIWAEFNATERNLEERTIVAFPTGKAFSAKEGTRLIYLGTLQFLNGAEIYHFYEEAKY